jgi:hypothetical protein
LNQESWSDGRLVLGYVRLYASDRWRSSECPEQKLPE